jgi:hypothetical protein
MHHAAHASSLVVSMATHELMCVRTRANAAYTPQGNGGTYVCTHESVARQTTKLSDRQLHAFAGWFAEDPEKEPIYRRLHPTEELRAMSWRDAEMPSMAKQALGNPTAPYEAISESICPSVFEAFAARMLWAMGKTLPAGTVTAEAQPVHIEIKRDARSGVEFTKLLGHNEACHKNATEE